MATKADILAAVAAHLEEVYEKEFTGQFAKQAQAGITDPQWDSIAQWAKDRNFAEIGKFVARRIRDKIQADAATEADAMLFDDQLSLIEYARVHQIP